MDAAEGLDLTTKQRANLKKLKSRLSDILQAHHGDVHLLKWLRVNKWDVENTEKLIRADQEWRRTNEVDSILSTYEPLEILTKYYPGGYCGVTKDGQPIWIDPLPKGDPKGFFQSVSKKELTRFVIWELEKLNRVMLPELSEKFGKTISQCVLIVDLDGMELKHLWKPAIDTLGDLTKMAEDHYPDTYSSIIAINAPAILPIAYSIFKPLLSQSTRSKIKIIGTDYKAYLLNEINADQLPVHWGGTASDPDGDTYCRSKICMGGIIPEKYYRKKMLTENIESTKFQAAVVNKGSKLRLEYPITVKNSLLSWHFYTEGSDIVFGVYRQATTDSRPKAADLEVIVPTEKVNSHVIPEAGNVVCQMPGTYVVHFDNSFKLLKANKVFYQIEVVEPDTTQEMPNA